VSLGKGGVCGEQRVSDQSVICGSRLCSRSVNWEEFERSAPELAAFGRDRLEGRVAFLATVRADGSPRVHPVEAWFAAGRMLVRMWPTSPKVRDLKHDPRYALHSLMDNFEGVGGEFFVAGRAARVDDQALIATASVGKHDPEQYVLFGFGVDEAIGTIYEGEEPVRHRMRAS
jgi:Pyridoxamine 5'-phosphate oxidase